jgi:hypothetical protein
LPKVAVLIPHAAIGADKKLVLARGYEVGELTIGPNKGALIAGGLIVQGANGNGYATAQTGGLAIADPDLGVSSACPAVVAARAILATAGNAAELPSRMICAAAANGRKAGVGSDGRELAVIACHVALTTGYDAEVIGHDIAKKTIAAAANDAAHDTGSGKVLASEKHVPGRKGVWIRRAKVSNNNVSCFQHEVLRIGGTEETACGDAAVAIQCPRTGTGGVHFRQRLRIAERDVVLARTGLAHRHFHPAGAIDVFRQVDLDAEVTVTQFHARQFGRFAQGFRIARIGKTAQAQVVGAFGRCNAVHEFAVIAELGRLQWQAQCQRRHCGQRDGAPAERGAMHVSCLRSRWRKACWHRSWHRP